MALVVVCLAQLMMVVDMTIVNVALPVIQRDLQFSQADLTWVVGAYLISYGSFLLLAGRLGDLLGRKRVFLAGTAIFTLASLACVALAACASAERPEPKGAMSAAITSAETAETDAKTNTNTKTSTAAEEWAEKKVNGADDGVKAPG